MQKQGTTWHCLAALAVLASCGLGVFAGAGADKKEAPKPLPPNIVKAWGDAGAHVGSMKMSRDGFVVFRFWEPGEAGARPAFLFIKWKEGALAKLPDPGTAFGLRLNGMQITAAVLKELTALKKLQALHVDSAPSVTNAGLKELAG